MDSIQFIWDPEKVSANERKHGVTFDEAQTVFYAPQARIISDPDHSKVEEERFILLGLSRSLRLLVVCHCYREQESVVRLISARKATRSEERQYYSLEGR